MGACCTADASTKEIESKMREQEQIDRRTIKLLFLGPGGSGKSTIFKQLQFLHAGGFTDTTAKALSQHIHCQIIKQMQDCIQYYLSPQNPESSAINISDTNDDELQQSIDTVRKYNTTNILTPEISKCIKYIWQNDDRLKDIFTIHHTTKILDETTEYFWNDIDRISAADYIPNEQDIMNVRYRTTGIVEKEFTIADHRFNIFDVGGQQSERKKWIQCFMDVKAVIFVVSLSCYNENMYEDITKNAMVDALELFNQTINDQHFTDTPFILFLNKMDLYEDKIKEIPITACPAFDDFNTETRNPYDYEGTLKYIQSEFESECENKNRNIFIHVTCAMDKQNIRHVFSDVLHIIVTDLQDNSPWL